MKHKMRDTAVSVTMRMAALGRGSIWGSGCAHRGLDHLLF